MKNIILVLTLLVCSPAFADETKQEKRAEQKRAEEVAKAEKRAKKAVNWAFEHRDRPMPVANVKGKCE